MVLGPEFDAVVRGARAADQACITALYRDLNARLLNYLRLKAPGEAEDLASETWIAVGRNIANFTGDEDAFRRWFFTIAHRQVTTHYRKVARRKTDPVEARTLDVASTGTDVSDVVAEKLATSELFATVTSRLPRDQAEVVRLRVIGGLSMDEIAEVMGKRAGTVRVLFHRAMGRLAVELGNHPTVKQQVAAKGVTP